MLYHLFQIMAGQDCPAPAYSLSHSGCGSRICYPPNCVLAAVMFSAYLVACFGKGAKLASPLLSEGPKAMHKQDGWGPWDLISALLCWGSGAEVCHEPLHPMTALIARTCPLTL